MTTLTDTQVITASGGLVELGYSQITSPKTINNATPGTGVEVIAPLTVVCDGGATLVEFFAPVVTPANTTGDNIYISLFQNGSEIVRYWTQMTASASGDFDRKPAYLKYRLSPSAGSHTFSVRAYVTNAARPGYIQAGNGSGQPESPAFLRVSKIVTATQWPAVTTGTIICTSSTRPASPFEGQRIYETDTNKEFVYDGAAWYSPGLQGYANKTSSQTVTTTADLTGLSVTWTAVASRVYRTSFIIPNGYPTVASYPSVFITDGSGSQKMYSANLLQSGEQDHWSGFYVESGISGSVTRKIRAGTNSGSFVIPLGTDNPGSIVVEDIGPA